jgi:hypothetical protein
MADPTRIRAQAAGGGTTVHLRMSHDIDAGDRIATTCKHNRGDSRSDEATVR